MKIKLLSEYFHPEPASTGRLMTQLAEGLVDRGLTVEAYTSQPTYQGQKRTSLPRHDQYNGVSIHRLRSSQLDKNNLFLRVVNWFTFSLAVLWNLLPAKRENTLYLVVTTPPIMPFVAALLSSFKRDRLVIIVYDVYPDAPIAKGFLNPDGLITRTWRLLNRFAYRQADRIVALDENMKQNVSEKWDDSNVTSKKKKKKKIKIIPNWEDPDFIVPKAKDKNEFARKHGYDKTFTLLYSGNLGRFHDLETLLGAAERVRDLPVQFVFIGDGAKKSKLKNVVERKSLDNVDFHPYQPVDNLPVTLTSADVSVVAEDPCMEGICVSCKIYSSLASGQALLGLAGETSEIARVIQSGQCGYVTEKGNVNTVAAYIRDWLDHPDRCTEMGKNARHHFLEHYTREKSISKYFQLIKSISVSS